MSHSKIFQISTSPISKDDYRAPSAYYDNSGDFADYIGEEVNEEDRKVCINSFAEDIADVFEPVGNGVFRYKGKDALHAFKQKWADYIKKLADELTADNILKHHRLFRLCNATKETHIDTAYRVDIDEWTGAVSYPIGELFEFADSELTDGANIYIGAVIDYHY